MDDISLGMYVYKTFMSQTHSDDNPNDDQVAMEAGWESVPVTAQTKERNRHICTVISTMSAFHSRHGADQTRLYHEPPTSYDIGWCR